MPPNPAAPGSGRRPARLRSAARRTAARAAALGLLTALGCGSGEPERDVAAAPAARDGAPYQGLYEVSGVTRVVGQPGERGVEGKIILREAPDGISATFNLRTRLPTEGGVVTADLNGAGQGTRVQGAAGPAIEGRAETQIILGAAPGLDPRFGFMPGRFGSRLESTWHAERSGPDSLRVSIKTHGVEGESYPETTTEMLARRTMGPKVLKSEEARIRAEREQATAGP